MKSRNVGPIIKRIWHFLWKEDSWESWIISIIIAFVLIKFLIYPGLGFALGTTHPIVAVVSGSMEHNGLSFDSWWDQKQADYEPLGISEQDFKDFPFKNGFNTGSIMFLKGTDPGDIDLGDIIVFRRPNVLENEPIIHRVVQIQQNGEFFSTRGDNNPMIYDFEHEIPAESVVGTATFTIPYLGYVKIGFVYLIKTITTIFR